MKRLLAALLFLCVGAIALADNYSGGGGGGGSSGVSLTCPPGGPFTTLNNNANVISVTGTSTLSTCGAIYKFTTSAATTGNLPAPSNGFYLTGVTNVPSSTNPVVLTPVSGQICAATCAATYSVAVGISVAVYSDGTNYFVQYSPAASATPIITGPGYITGNYYADPHIVNQAASTTALAATTAYCAPLSIYNLTPTTNGTGTVGTVAVQITTLAAAGNVQAAIYNNNTANNRPGTLVASSASMSTAATGPVTGTISAAVAPGFYWTCTQADNTTVRLTVPNTGVFLSALAGSTSAGAITGNTSGALTTTTGITSFGTWPSFVSATWTQVSNIAPIVQINFSSITP